MDRLAADVDLHTRLALLGFTGPEYDQFRLELTRYGLDVMTGWLRTGKIFARMEAKGYRLPVAPDKALDGETQEELAGETVSKALHHFHLDVLLRGRWDPRKGARLTTFFVGQCLIRFANIYRAWHRQEMRRESLLVEPSDMPEQAGPQIDGPEWRAVARAQIRRGLGGVRDPRLPRVFFLIATGCTQGEVAEEFGITEKAVERMLANHLERITRLGIA